MAKPTRQMKLKLLILIWIAFPFVAMLKSVVDQRAVRLSEREQQSQMLLEEVEREALLSRMMEVAQAKRWK